MATATPAQTPNPNALRFQLDVTIAEPLNASSPDEAASHPLLAALLGIDGVASVFATADFITVTRSRGADWDAIVPQVQAAVAENL